MTWNNDFANFSILFSKARQIESFNSGAMTWEFLNQFGNIVLNNGQELAFKFNALDPALKLVVKQMKDAKSEEVHYKKQFYFKKEKKTMIRSIPTIR